MSSHLTHDDLVLAYYREAEAGQEHLDTCAECRAELARLAGILDRVTPEEAPEPDAGYEKRVWERLSWRLQARPQKRTNRFQWLAVAAAIALAFITGLLINGRRTQPVGVVATSEPVVPATVQNTAASTQQQRDRILLVVVGDHLDNSERMLLELTNLTAKDDVDVSSQSQRAEELLVSNRLYRRTALDRGEDRVATLLDELEPMLMQIAHGPAQLTPEELRKVQKRVETKGLVFKLRVLRADVRATSVPHLQQPDI